MLTLLTLLLIETSSSVVVAFFKTSFNKCTIDIKTSGILKNLESSTIKCDNTLTIKLEENKALINYKENVINLKVSNTIDVNKLIKQLVIMGYRRTPSTQQTGDFSVRGEIIDIFAINNELPYRIGLFDDEVDWKHEYLDEARRYYTNIVGKFAYIKFVRFKIWGAKKWLNG